MKVFVRDDEVIAYYDDNADVSSDAHGAGVTMLTVPGNAITHEMDPNHVLPPRVKLAHDWRTRSAETKRTDRLGTLHELVELVIHHGSNIAAWPAEAKTRKSEIDKMWKA
jgi:hypothetical protein